MPIENFDGFIVVILGNNSMDCSKWIPKLQLTIGDYTVIGNFYVVNVVDTNMVLGVQWLLSIGEHSANYKVLDMIFKDSDGKHVVLKGINTYPIQVMTFHSMSYILIHGDIEWVNDCLISSQGSSIDISQHPNDIKQWLKKYE